MAQIMKKDHQFTNAEGGFRSKDFERQGGEKMQDLGDVMGTKEARWGDQWMQKSQERNEALKKAMKDVVQKAKDETYKRERPELKEIRKLLHCLKDDRQLGLDLWSPKEWRELPDEAIKELIDIHAKSMKEAATKAAAKLDDMDIKLKEIEVEHQQVEKEMEEQVASYKKIQLEEEEKTSEGEVAKKDEVKGSTEKQRPETARQRIQRLRTQMKAKEKAEEAAEDENRDKEMRRSPIETKANPRPANMPGCMDSRPSRCHVSKAEIRDSSGSRSREGETQGAMKRRIIAEAKWYGQQEFESVD